MTFLAHFTIGSLRYPREPNAICLLHAVADADRWRARASLYLLQPGPGLRPGSSFVDYSQDIDSTAVDHVRGLFTEFFSSDWSGQVSATIDGALRPLGLSLRVVDRRYLVSLDLPLSLSGLSGSMAPLLSRALSDMIALSGAGDVWVLRCLAST
jgi:hypothetical protein